SINQATVTGDSAAIRVEPKSKSKGIGIEVERRDGHPRIGRVGDRFQSFVSGLEPRKIGRPRPGNTVESILRGASVGAVMPAPISGRCWTSGRILCCFVHPPIGYGMTRHNGTFVGAGGLNHGQIGWRTAGDGADGISYHHCVCSSVARTEIA